VAQEGIAVKGVHRIQGALIEVGAHERLEMNAGLGDPAALAPGFFALLGGEGLEIGLEARVAAVGPVELAVAADQPAGVGAHRARRLIQKQGVHRGETVRWRRTSRSLSEVGGGGLPVEIRDGPGGADRSRA
jgi:hypothetical protein